ncbi:thiosulfate/3-mercaptopyruvate sulfurtransferase [Vibrio xiamenensis]|uniref:Thiosulfate/3-mercaptopyruvate sulfurtransferase n=1 Tax=Vibrio xiamenensis TaxID=861298 RepID=A0A1G8CQR3_9VIBR|nr:rhodanese-like domain-containing protein [Vibrio xiamenensis]SDH47788.1 thiosulfate/3-mercaptopyruvate sulfurtransferase [Vibrio xiamenensis]
MSAAFTPSVLSSTALKLSNTTSSRFTLHSIGCLVGAMLISAPSLAAQEQNSQLIDCRASEYFNGWPEVGMSKGGHLPGAINVRPEWLNAMSASEKQAYLFEQKQLDASKPTQVYCAAKKAELLVEQLKDAGFKSVSLKKNALQENMNQLVALPHFEQLVSADWLNRLVNQPAELAALLPKAPKHQFTVIEAGWGAPKSYLVSHIKGAVYADTNLFESEPLWNQVSDDKLKSAIEALGILPDSTVILYGRDNMAAARIGQILMYAGVADVRLLDGGWDAWQSGEFATESGDVKAEKSSFDSAIPAHPEYVIGLNSAKQLLKDPEHNSLVSVRTWSEYIGDISGYTYIEPKGRIAGAKWGQGGKNANNLDDFTNPDGTMRAAEEIARKWRDWNIYPDQNVSFYCGTGWRAAEVFLFAHAMGWSNISVFDGGWYEWSMDKSNPTQTGAVSAANATAVPKA